MRSEKEVAANVRSLIASTRDHGVDLSVPRRITHQVFAPTGDAARELARRLDDAGYTVERVFDDDDYQRWEVEVSEKLMVNVDAVMDARARLEPLVAGFGRLDSGVGIYVVDDGLRRIRAADDAEGRSENA
jgi:Regulator of ribonuclease activity B